MLPDAVVQKVGGEDMYGNIENKGPELPVWVKSAAKLLNGGGDKQDWTELARKLGQSWVTETRSVRGHGN